MSSEQKFSAMEGGADMPVSTNTVVLSRKSMGMNNIPRQNVQKQSSFAPGGSNAGQRPTVATKATDDMVWCPSCDANFEIPSEFFGQLAECSECGVEFQIPQAPTIKKAAPRATAAAPAADTHRSSTVPSFAPSVPAPKKGRNGMMVLLAVINIIALLVIIAIFIAKKNS